MSARDWRAKRREVVSRLRDDDKGVATCHAPAVKFPVAHMMEQSVTLPGPKGLTVYLNSLSMLVAEKVQRSLFFAALLQAALQRAQSQLTLIIFSDEANPGNVLHARHPRKTNLVYASFLELPALFVDSLWLPVSAVRADDVTTHETSYAEVMRHVLESSREETEHGVTVCFGESAHLFFIERVLLLNDHEGLRGVTGAKGSAGVKCCCHCINVLSLGRTFPLGYDISESSPSKFVQQTWQLCNDVWPRVERKRSSPKWKLCWDGTPILSANPYSHLTACLVGLKWTVCIWTQCINLKVEVWWLRRSAAGTRGLSIAGTQCRCFSNGPISFGQLRMAISHRL